MHTLFPHGAAGRRPQGISAVPHGISTKHMHASEQDGGKRHSHRVQSRTQGRAGPAASVAVRVSEMNVCVSAIHAHPCTAVSSVWEGTASLSSPASAEAVQQNPCHRGATASRKSGHAVIARVQELLHAWTMPLHGRPRCYTVCVRKTPGRSCGGMQEHRLNKLCHNARGHAFMLRALWQTPPGCGCCVCMNAAQQQCYVASSVCATTNASS